MSRVATLPASAAELASAPEATFSPWTELSLNSPSLTTTAPEVPFGMSRLATSTECSTVPPWTRSLYREVNPRSTIPASTAAVAAIVMAPPRVPAMRRSPSSSDLFCVACMVVPPLSRHDGGAPADRAVPIAGHVTWRHVECCDVCDEMADDVGRVVARDRVVAVALARVVEPVALARPSGYVEVGEVLHGNVAARARAVVLERAVRHDHDRHDARIAGAEARPVVGARARRGLGSAEDAPVHAG